MAPHVIYDSITDYSYQKCMSVIINVGMTISHLIKKTASSTPIQKQLRLLPHQTKGHVLKEGFWSEVPVFLVLYMNSSAQIEVCESELYLSIVLTVLQVRISREWLTEMCSALCVYIYIRNQEWQTAT